MKKGIALALAAVMLLPLAACGGKPAAGSTSQPQTVSESNGQAPAPASSSTVETSAPQDSTPEKAPAAPVESAGIAPAENGTLTLSMADIAVVVKGTPVPMPYRLQALADAGVPVDESYKDLEVTPDGYYNISLYLDENQDYVLSPAYYNGSEKDIPLGDAGAGEINMTTYASEPQDQGISILGIDFGTPKSEVLERLGQPSEDYGGDQMEWLVKVSDGAYKGSLIVWFTSGSDDATVAQVDLSMIEE